MQLLGLSRGGFVLIAGTRAFRVGEGGELVRVVESGIAVCTFELGGSDGCISQSRTPPDSCNTSP